ncbi:Glycosyltransferase family 2 protein [Burkholderiales bacterium 8X]|nr:Glycosyltransferase family 2 protein [Burkholderiales bacterium 8X]
MAASISVALCTRNGARFLAAQVESICAQDLLPAQIVVSDDGSSDDSIEVVRQTVERLGLAGRIELDVFHNPTPLGVTRNFEQAVKACRHELIALCDQDDVWHAGRLKRMAASFEADPELLLLHTDARLVDAELRPIGPTLFEALEVEPWEIQAIHEGRAFQVLLRRNLATGATTMFRRRLLEAALPFSAEWVHDEWLASIAAAIGRVDLLPEPTIDYRQHGNNQIGARPPTLAEKVRKALDSRGDKHLQRWRRAVALLDRLIGLGDRVEPGIVEAQRAKVAHQRFRADLPASRWRRLGAVIREARAGGYDRFGRGKQAVAQDLLERG